MELQKGQKIKLTDLTSEKQIQLRVSVKMKTGEADVTCFGVDANEKLSDDRYFVFYNQTTTPENAISMSTGGGNTTFSIDISKLPPFIKKLVLTVATDGSAVMGDVTEGSVTVLAANQAAASYGFTGVNFAQEKALILCELYEKDGIWRLSVVANGFNGGLNTLLAHFGGEEQAPVITPTPPAPAFVKKPVSQAPTPVQPISATPPAPSAGPINLRKGGDTHKISLQKDNNPRIHANLNWNIVKKTGFFSPKPIDLDLACMFRLKTGHQGIIQALGNSFGSADQLPFIRLDKDDRTGSSMNGENMFFSKPELIEFAVVFAYIYEGVPNWKNTGAYVILKQQGSQDIEIHIDNTNSSDRFCVIASLTGKGDQLEVKREEMFFAGHREVDRHYGFGFQWKTGRK